MPNRSYKFSVLKHKVSVKELTDGRWEGSISCPDNGGSFKIVCDDIETLKSELHELANNTTAGRAVSEKIYDWYYGQGEQSYEYA